MVLQPLTFGSSPVGPLSPKRGHLVSALIGSFEPDGELERGLLALLLVRDDEYLESLLGVLCPHLHGNNVLSVHLSYQKHHIIFQKDIKI